MARIAGVDLQDNWRLDYALTNIKGVGWALSRDALKSLNLDAAKHVKDLTPDEVAKLASKVDEYVIEGDLIKKVRTDIQRLKTIGSYRGIRHSRNLPTRGQRTRSNARTKRGKRKTVGAFKKEALSKVEAGKGGEKEAAK
jgi:small subunit ribosomal protein S13